jgi:hypothetical protein
MLPQRKNHEDYWKIWNKIIHLSRHHQISRRKRKGANSKSVDQEKLDSGQLFRNFDGLGYHKTAISIMRIRLFIPKRKNIFFQLECNSM